MAERVKKGIFIAFEGPEGSGKSVHSRHVVETLQAEGFGVIHAAQPGDTELGLFIRDVLLKKDDIDITQLSELFLFLADRAQHVQQVIKPALAEGRIIICDRFSSATLAYQGYGLGMDIDMIKKMNDIATSGIYPDLTILLDVLPLKGLARARSRSELDRMEKRNIDFHNKVRDGYLSMAKENAEKFVVIDASEENIDDIFKVIMERIREFIERT